jgi:hypothetical protein
VEILVAIKSTDELPDDRRKPCEPMLGRFEKLQRRLKQDGKPMMSW